MLRDHPGGSENPHADRIPDQDCDTEPDAEDPQETAGISGVMSVASLVRASGQGHQGNRAGLGGIVITFRSVDEGHITLVLRTRAFWEFQVRTIA